VFSTQISDFKTPIVLDTGSGVMKAGFSDQELPSVIFPTIIGLPKYEVMSWQIRSGHHVQIIVAMF